MSGHFLLDWAALAISVFNAVLLLWLGATVLLNADRRTWGIVLAGGALLLGGAFFITHAAMLNLGRADLVQGLRTWWYLSLFPAVILPLAWYVVILWYSGYWTGPAATSLRRRQRRWLIGMLVLAAAGLLAGIAYANPVPQAFSLLPLRLLIDGVGGTPLLVGGYACYVLGCIGLSLDALVRPGPTARMMGDLARQRARGWLLAATLLLLLVSLLVIATLLWILGSLRQGGLYLVTETTLTRLIALDLLIAGLIGAVILVLGQAVVAYEIFTGKTLPRQGLRRQWWRAISLAAGYGTLVAWTLAAHWRPVYSVLLATLLMTAFFALLGWRSYAERERTMAHIRPFVSGQRLYDQLLAEKPVLEAVNAPFYTLCHDVLGTRRALLLPLGPLAPLAGPPLVYPAGDPFPAPPLEPLTAKALQQRPLVLPLDPTAYHGARWALPLWNERGLSGLLLLGGKAGGGVYTQEEMEIARATGERLVDTQASAEMARRLLALQRQRLASSQLLDRRTRRVLHDDVLPQIHAALLALDGAGAERREVTALLTNVHRQISDLLRDTPPAVTPEVARSGPLGALQRVVNVELAAAFDEVAWDVPGELVARARSVPALAAEVLFYAAREAVRNAARHGRGGAEGRPLCLHVTAAWDAEGLTVTVEDNGVGLVAEEGGNGRGLALHSTMLAVVGGTLALASEPGAYTRVSLSLPTAALEEAGREREATS